MLAVGSQRSAVSKSRYWEVAPTEEGLTDCRNVGSIQ